MDQQEKWSLIHMRIKGLLLHDKGKDDYVLQDIHRGFLWPLRHACPLLPLISGMFTKGPCIFSLVPSPWCCAQVVETLKRWGLVGGVLTVGAMLGKDVLELWPFFLGFHLWLWNGWLCATLCSPPWCVVSPQIQNQWANWSWTGTSRTVSQINLSFR